MWRRFKCWLGTHEWRKTEPGRWDSHWKCSHCGKEPKTCDNCGKQHDPNAFLTICTVTRSNW